MKKNKNKTLEELGYKKVENSNKTIEYSHYEPQQYTRRRIIIDRQTGVQKILEYTTSLGYAEDRYIEPLTFEELQSCADIISNLPPVKTTNWIKHWYYCDDTLECDNCKFTTISKTAYCPNCHYKMIQVIGTTKEND